MTVTRFSALCLNLCMVLAFALSPPANAQATDNAVNETALLAAVTLDRQLQESVNRRIPTDLRSQARCIAVFPSVVKAGLIIAAKQGNGLISCRHAETKKWGSPAYFSVSATSVGIQAGIQNASYIMLFMDDMSMEDLFDSKLSFGSDVSIAAGPVGAAGNYSQQPSVVSYVRTAGLFAGVDLEGATLDFAADANKQLYDANATAEHILTETVDVPLALEPFHAALQRFSP